MNEYESYENFTEEHEKNDNLPPFTNNFPGYQMPKQEKERLKVRKAANIIGFSLVILTLFSTFWASGYYLIMSKIGIDMKKAQEIITEPGTLQFVQILFSIIVFTLPFILLVKINGERVSDLVPFKKCNKNQILPYYFIGIGFCAFANIATNIAGAIFESFGVSYDVDFGDTPSGAFGFMLTLISTAIVPALVEEFACRGIMLNLLKKQGDAFAIIVSALLFGLVHGNFEQIPFAFMVGLVLGFITVKTGSIFIAIAVHFTNNLISVIFSYVNLSLMARNVVYIIYLSVCMLLAVISVCSFREKNFFSLQKSESEVSARVRAKWFFTSPVIIIFIALSILEAILHFF
ncbi:MAG: CPBP family intramembrane metalloprotease [Clostridia bacterium]|nr:CPBP family intramembrane metalloprotease [Clostridia bacterium]